MVDEEKEEEHKHEWGPVHGYYRECTIPPCTAEELVQNEAWESHLEEGIVFDM